MKKLLAIVLTVALLSLGLGAGIVIAADPPSQTGDAMELSLAGADPPMPLDGTWVILDEYMDVGDFFTGPYTWTSDYLIRFTVTDIYVVSDQFAVYDDGGLVVTTPAMPDWDDLGFSDPYDSPPWTDDPDVALADGRFSSAVMYFGPGSHSIDIRDIHIPPTTAGGEPFPDGTVAFKAEPLVEFTKEITDVVEAGDMDGVLETGEKWEWELRVELTNISGETIRIDKVHDRIGGDLEADWLLYYAPLGPLNMYTKGKTEKVFFDFECIGGMTLADGASAYFEIWVSPDVNTGKGTANNAGNSGKNPKPGHQEFTSPGEHCLNSGAYFEGYIGDEFISASTLPVCVDVAEYVETPQ
jgi:hypothetical protein